VEPGRGAIEAVKIGANLVLLLIPLGLMLGFALLADQIGVELAALSIGLALLYIAPFLLALNRRHSRRWWILALTLGLGWTGIGYLVALAWALTEDRRVLPGA
jgi:ABC-type transport system involved in cytochrome c biogenesis permease component